MRELTKVAFEETHGGRRLRIVLRGGAGNVVDCALAQELADVLETRVDGRHLRAVTLEAEGADFSTGARAEDLVPAADAGLLPRMHRTVVEMIESDLPILVAVRGRCLGAGLDLVLGCHRIFAAPDARLGHPGVAHGLFSTAGSVLLPERVARGLAEEMLLTGRVLDAETARGAGLVDEVAPDPESAALRWFETHLLPRSAMALRFATRAARAVHRKRLRDALSEVERRFLDDYLPTRDARESLAATTAGREAVWVDA